MATFWEIAARSVGHLFSLSFVYLYNNLLPVLVLRAGFGFWLLQFLFIAFLLLFEITFYLSYKHTNSCFPYFHVKDLVRSQIMPVSQHVQCHFILPLKYKMAQMHPKTCSEPVTQRRDLVKVLTYQTTK